MTKKHTIGSYVKYVKLYKQREQTLLKKGFKMKYDMLDKVGFRKQYKRYYNTRKQEIKNGERKTFGNIYGEIVSTHVSDISYAQAKNIKAAGKKLGYNFDITRIRKVDIKTDPDMCEFWETVKESYHEMKESMQEEFDSYELQSWLARNFFGSP